MSDNHDHEPDRAALDELLRAFGDGSGSTAESMPVVIPLEDDVEPGDGGGESDPTGEPAEILIVEQEPLVAPADPTPAPPTIIRIDDLSGSVVVEEVSDPPPVARAQPQGNDQAGAHRDATAGAADGDEADGGVADGEVADREAAGAGETDAGAPDGDAVRGGGTDAGAPDGDAVDDGSPGGGAGTPVVISIEDEDLPDAVYVEGDLDGVGSRTIVFIEDDDTGDTVTPDVERDVRRGIEPRLRERRAAVRRAIGRKRLRWMLLATLVVVVGAGTLALLGSGLFAIKAENVEVYGAVYADPERVEAVVDGLVGTPALRADTQAAEEALEAIPWVDEARVRVSFPNSATIEIREREAWTTYQGPDQRYRVLDREGRVLAVLDGYPIAYLLLAGPDPVDLDAGDFAPQGYAAASELAKNLTGSIRGQVSFVSVTADGSSLTIFLDDGTEVRFGAARDLFNKLLRLETTLANNPDREPGVIDVSTSEVTL